MKQRAFEMAAVMLILMVLFCLPAAKAEIYAKSAHRMMYAVSDKYVWTVNERGAVSCFDKNKVKTDMSSISGAMRISAYGSTLYCLTQQNEMAVVSADSESVTYYPILSTLNIRQIEAVDGVLYILASEPSENNFRIYAADPYGIRFYNPLLVEGWENGNISTIAYYKGILCAYRTVDGMLSAIHITDNMTGELLYKPIEMADLQYVQVGETTENTLHIFALNNPEKQVQLWDVNAFTGEKAPASLHCPDDAIGLRRDKDNLYVLSREGTELYQLPIKKVASVQTLTLKNFIGDIQSPDRRLKIAAEMFYQKYPEVELQTDFETDVRVTAAAIMAGTPGYDIITVQENFTLIPSILMFKAGAAVNLFDYSEFAELADYSSGQLAPFMADGQLFAVPDTIIPIVWSIDAEIEQLLGLTVPRDGWLWDDFFNLAAAIKEYNQNSKDHIYLLHDSTDVLPYFLKMFNANYVDALHGYADYTNTDFIRLLGEWTEAYKENLILFRTDENSEKSLLHVNIIYYEDLDDYSLLLPPAFNEETRYPAKITSLVLNANSQLKTEGAYFLACWMSEEAISADVTVSNSGHLLSAADSYAASMTDNYAIWQYMLAHTANDYYIGDLYKDQWQTLYPKLINEEITPLQYAQMCQQRAEMVLGE